jgi:hypothetical protein
MSHTNPVRISPLSKVPPRVVFFSVIVRVSPEISKRADAETLSPVSAFLPEPTKKPALQGAAARVMPSATIPAATRDLENHGILMQLSF